MISVPPTSKIPGFLYATASDDTVCVLFSKYSGRLIAVFRYLNKACSSFKGCLGLVGPSRKVWLGDPLLALFPTVRQEALSEKEGAGRKMKTGKEGEGRQRTAPGVGFNMSLVIFAG